MPAATTAPIAVRPELSVTDAAWVAGLGHGLDGGRARPPEGLPPEERAAWGRGYLAGVDGAEWTLDLAFLDRHPEAHTGEVGLDVEPDSPALDLTKEGTP